VRITVDCALRCHLISFHTLTTDQSEVSQCDSVVLGVIQWFSVRMRGGFGLVARRDGSNQPEMGPRWARDGQTPTPLLFTWDSNVLPYLLQESWEQTRAA